MEKHGKMAVFFWAATAGLGKYSMGGYSRIGVYKVNHASTLATHTFASLPDGVHCARVYLSFYLRQDAYDYNK